MINGFVWYRIRVGNNTLLCLCVRMRVSASVVGHNWRQKMRVTVEPEGKSILQITTVSFPGCFLPAHCVPYALILFSFRRFPFSFSTPFCINLHYRVFFVSSSPPTSHASCATIIGLCCRYIAAL